MQAAVIDRFGGPETFTVEELPVPKITPDQVLIQVESAGVGKWDAFEREGMFAQMIGGTPQFPYVLGSEGAGRIVALGEKVRHFYVGDQVYGFVGARNPKAGFYAEYAAVESSQVWGVPDKLTTEKAGAMPIDGGTALRGLRDILALKRGETLMVFGASGGMGHLAVQLGKRMGARVLAVASGTNGVELVQKLGADAVVEGHHGDVEVAAHEFAPNGIDTALITAGGKAVEKALASMRAGGRVAYPMGVQPQPVGRSDLQVKGYSANTDRELMDKLNELIDLDPFEVHIAQIFPLLHVDEAHRVLNSHYVGRLALHP